MAVALDLLWEEYDRDGARGLLGDERARMACLRRVIASTRDGRAESPMMGSVGDNLFMGVVALRVKFDREASIAKLVRNVQMRAEHESRAG